MVARTPQRAGAEEEEEAAAIGVCWPLACFLGGGKERVLIRWGGVFLVCGGGRVGEVRRNKKETRSGVEWSGGDGDG
jgi:hypothetical protein